MCREAFFSSIIEALIDYCVEICAKPARIDARCAVREPLLQKALRGERTDASESVATPQPVCRCALPQWFRRLLLRAGLQPTDCEARAG
jgi:hypothetical protein